MKWLRLINKVRDYFARKRIIEKKLQFPMLPKDDSCPNCGSKERIGKQCIQELKENGKLSKRAFPEETLMLQMPLFDQTRVPLTTNFAIPVLQVRFDVCKECFTIVCTGVNLVYQPAQIQGMPGIPRI